MTQYAPILDKVEDLGVKISEFINAHPDCAILLDMISEYAEAKDEAGKQLKSESQGSGITSFISKSGRVSTKIDKTQKIDGDALIRDHGQELLDNNPLCLSVLKTKYNKFPLENVDLSKYLENPTFSATVSNTDTMMKVLEKSLEYALECKGIAKPNKTDDIEHWFAVYDSIKKV